MEKTLRKGGASLTYIPVSEVITRLNKILGVANWSSQIVSCARDQLDPDYIVAHVRLETIIDGNMVSKDGIGGQKIKRTKSGDIVDLGDEMKGAVSDALKKAAQQLGVGLYLARDIDAIEVEYAMSADSVETTMSEEDIAYEKFSEIREMLTDEQRGQLKEWWLTYADGRPVPKKSELTLEEIKAMTIEAIRIQFDGTVRVDTSSEG
jgi:recombination DNA repair RAD52 pathway protein